MPDNLTPIDKKILERGYWVATHRLAIKKWTSVSLYALIAIVYTIFFIQFGVYAFRAEQWENLVQNSLVNQYDWTSIHEASAPRELELGVPVIVSVGDDKYDLIVEVLNPNEQWAIDSLKYTFQVNTEAELPVVETFILPQQQRYLTLLNYQSEGPINSASIELLNTEWNRLFDAPDINWIYDEKPIFTGRQVVSNQGKQSIIPARVTWSVKNATAYNFREVIWQVGLYKSGSLLGVLEYKSEKMKFFDSRDFELFINFNVPRVEAIEIYPLVNIFDPEYTYLE